RDRVATGRGDHAQPQLARGAACAAVGRDDRGERDGDGEATQTSIAARRGVIGAGISGGLLSGCYRVAAAAPPRSSSRCIASVTRASPRPARDAASTTASRDGASKTWKQISSSATKYVRT